MATPTFPTLSPGFEGLPVNGIHDWETIVTPMEMGHRGTCDRFTKPLRTFEITNKILSQRNWEIIMGFYNQVRNSTSFNWTSTEKVISPYEEATLSSGGVSTLGARTLYVAYTWGDGTDETLYSQEESQAVGNTELLTVDVPWFPSGVTQANIYIGTVSGTLYRVSEITTDGGSWTEAETSVDGDSNSGQKVINVDDESGFTAGDAIVLNSGGAREETLIVDTTAAGQITATTNLQYTHTALQADAVNHDYTSGSSLPTANTLDETILVRFLGRPQRWRRKTATNYQAFIAFEEQF